MIMKWYIFYSSRLGTTLKSTLAHLKRVLGEENVLCPTNKVERIVKGKVVEKDLSTFPGYIFARIDDAKINDVYKLYEEIGGGLTLLRNGNKLAQVSDEEISRTIECSKGIKKISVFKIGDTVRFIDTPFKNFSGMIENIEMGIVDVAVEIFGRSTLVKATHNQLRPI